MGDDAQKLQSNVDELRITWSAGPYYEEAEAGMDAQWRDLIWPFIKGCDFSCVLELAPGHGRNTAKLMQHATRIDLVDINEPCIHACRKRFENDRGSCRLFYHVNDGATMPMIRDGFITLVYSWDAMVHFDKLVCEQYVHEFTRVMAPGAYGFVHHSNYGALESSEDVNWMEGPAWRSTMSGELFAQYCEEAGLVIERQRYLPWSGTDNLDCISFFRKPQ